MLEKAASAEDEVELVPRAGFVVKTRLEEGTAEPHREAGTKVFLNICSDDNVPLPEVGYDPKVIYPLIMNNEWEIPIVTSQERVDKDKKGNLAYVYDCIINTKAMRWIQIDNDLREILVEWSIESAELRSGIRLSRENISTPKMTSKGEIGKLKILKSDMDLNRLNKEFEEKINDLENNPMSIIEAKRFEEEEKLKDSDGKIDIFNANRDKPSSTKPLIQEIENMTISTKQDPKPTVQPNTENRVKEQLKYETTISKIDINGYKLKIEIKSQNDSSLDYNLDIDRSTNTLILQNMNPKYQAKDLELPLPSIFTSPEFKSFFVHKDSTLIVFIK